MLEKPPIASSVMVASEPPVRHTSVSPSRTDRKASPMAWELDAHAEAAT